LLALVYGIATNQGRINYNSNLILFNREDSCPLQTVAKGNVIYSRKMVL
jgi:hypothetical protein